MKVLNVQPLLSMNTQAFEKRLYNAQDNTEKNMVIIDEKNEEIESEEEEKEKNMVIKEEPQEYSSNDSFCSDGEATLDSEDYPIQH